MAETTAWEYACQKYGTGGSDVISIFYCRDGDMFYSRKQIQIMTIRREVTHTTTELTWPENSIDTEI
jgi:hypothetical protein